MAEDGIQGDSRPSGETPPSADNGLSSPQVPLAHPQISPVARLLIYLVALIVLSGTWIAVLWAFNYNGMYPALVGVVLGIITFLSCRSFLVDRFLKIQPEQALAPQPVDNIREIIETVVFVVVLVLLLKSFVAEAFQIPTGSMATTLYGYQKMAQCPDLRPSFSGQRQ